MKVIFKRNAEPCIQYRVLSEKPVMEYDEIFGRYMSCIDIEVLGLVPEILLKEATHPDNIDAIDVLIEIQKTS